MNAAAIFVTVIALFVLAGLGAWLALWLADIAFRFVGRNEWDELDDLEQARAVMRHPSNGDQS